MKKRHIVADWEGNVDRDSYAPDKVFYDETIPMPSSDDNSNTQNKDVGSTASLPMLQKDDSFFSRLQNWDEKLNNGFDSLLKSNPVTSFLARAGQAGANTMTGGGAIDGNYDTGSKLANGVADIVGTGLGFAERLPGLDSSIGSAMDKTIGQPVKNTLEDFATKYGIDNKLTDYGIQALKTGAEFGGYEGLNNAIQGKDIGQGIAEGMGSGMAFGAGSKALGDIGNLAIKGIGKVKVLATEGNRVKFQDENGNVQDMNKSIFDNTVQSLDTANPTYANANLDDVFTPNGIVRNKPVQNEIPLPNVNTPVENKLPSMNLKTQNSAVDIPNLNINLQTHSNPLGIDMNALSRRGEINDKKLFEERTGRSPQEGDYKERQTIANSFMNSEAIPQEVKDSLAKDPSKYQYLEHNNEQAMSKARNIVDQNFDSAVSKINNLKALQDDSDTALAIEIERKYIENGEYDKARDWSLKVAKLGTKSGQAIQYFSTIKKLTPQWSLNRASKMIDSAVTDKQRTQLDASTRQISDEMNKVNQQSINEVLSNPDIQNAIQKTKNTTTQNNGKLTPEEMLSKKVSSHVSDGSIKDNPIKDMVNTLYKVAQQTLPKKETISRSPLDFIKQAMNDKEHYSDVWGKAQQIVKDKYKDNPEALDNLEGYFNQLLDKPFSDKQLTNAVKQGVKDNNMDLNSLVREHYSKLDSANKTLSEKLIENGINPDVSKELETYVQNEFNRLATTKKQQILDNMFKERKTPQRKEFIDKVIELSNLGAFDNSKYTDLVAKKWDIPHLSSNTTKQIVDLSNKIQEMPEGRAKREAIARLNDTIQREIPVSVLDKLNSMQTLSMLSGTKTPIRNIIGNTLFKTVDNLKEIPRTLIDMPLSLFTKERTATLPMLGSQLKGYGSGMKEAFLDLKNDVNTKDVGDKFELNRRVTWDKDGNLVNKAMHQAERVNRFALDDRPAMSSAYEGEMARQRKLAKINGTEFDEATAKEKATLKALHDTFNDDTAISDMVTNLKRNANIAGNSILTGNGIGRKLDQATKNEFAKWGAGDLLVKFAKVPSNIIARQIEYSPLSIISPFINAVRGAIKGEKFDQEHFSDTLAKGLTGTGIMGLGAMLHNVMTTDSDKNKNKSELDKESGLGQFKMNLSALQRLISGGDTKTQKGDTIASYDWANPISVLLAAGASMAKATDGKTVKGVGKIAGTLMDALNEGVNSVIEQPMNQGLKTWIQQGDMMGGLSQAIAALPQTFIPSLVNQFRQLSDNTTRETYDPNIFKQGLNQMINRIPGLEQQLPQKVDIWGKGKETFQNGTNDLLNVFLNPAINTQYLPTPETQKAFDLYAKTANSEALPKLADKTLDVDNKKVKLTPDQFIQLQSTMGQGAKDIYDRILTDDNSNKLAKDTAKALSDNSQDSKIKVLQDNNLPLPLSVTKESLSKDLYKKRSTESKTVRDKIKDITNSDMTIDEQKKALEDLRGQSQNAAKKNPPKPRGRKKKSN